MQEEETIVVTYKGHADGSVDFYGAAVERVTGYTWQDFSADRGLWPSLIHPEDKEKNKAIFIKALKSNKTYAREYRIIDKHNRIHWLMEYSQIIMEDDGKIAFVIGSTLDITREKQEKILRQKRQSMTGKYQFFSIANQEYGLAILKIREIIQLLPITPVPNAADYVLGIMNLRGKVIPVIDLKRKLGLEGSDCSDRACIINVEVKRKEGIGIVGILVDSVSEVILLDYEMIEEPPPFFTPYLDCLLGMVKINQTVKLLFDFDRLLGNANYDLALAEKSSGQPDDL